MPVKAIFSIIAIHPSTGYADKIDSCSCDFSS